MKQIFYVTAILFGMLFFGGMSSVRAQTSDAGITLNAKEFTLWAQAGAVQLDMDWTWTATGGLRVGVSNRVELGFPPALSFALLKRAPTEVAVTAGVTDFRVYSHDQRLFTPAVQVHAKSHLSHEAAAFYSADYTHVQSNFDRSPGFLRGAAAFRVDMGPYLSWCIGISYQRILVDRPLPDELPRSGLAGAQRVTLGSVRAVPYDDLPVFVIHTGSILHFTVHARLDIDTDTDTTDARILGGIRLLWTRDEK